MREKAKHNAVEMKERKYHLKQNRDHTLLAQVDDGYIFVLIIIPVELHIVVLLSSTIKTNILATGTHRISCTRS